MKLCFNSKTEFKPTFIRAFYKNGRKIHMITLANIESAKDIYNLPSLFYIKI